MISKPLGIEVKFYQSQLLFHNRRKDQTNMTKLYTNRLDHWFFFTPRITAAIVGSKIEVLVVSEEQQAGTEFKAKKAHGKFPMLELEDGTIIFESNAIAAYLARAADKQDFLGTTPFAQAQVD